MGEGDSARLGSAALDAATVLAFTGTTFLSAFLLFALQPMFTKMVLPLLGGAPSVWAVALLFFQGALLAGYAYAHLVIGRIPARRTGYVHLAFTALAFVALPIAIPASWSEPPPGDAYLWQLGLFATAIGLPFVAVSANAPMIQAWFARTGHPAAGDPYFLYAASNLGSLIALLGYPFLLEPVFGLRALALFWTFGYALLLVALAGCFWIVRIRSTGQGEAEIPPAVGAGMRGTPTWRDRLAWIGLALIPSALLTAFTTHVATDVASAPLIWVIPLALYLATFVVVFRERALIPPKLLLALHLAATVLALLQLAQVSKTTWFYTAGCGVAAFITATLVAHRTLYEHRPDARHLTDFYMCMSVGGVLGGLFAALIAPKIFSEVLEYPLLLALSFACRPGALALGAANRRALALLVVLVALGATVIAWGPDVARYFQWGFGGWGSTAGIAAIFAVAALLFWRLPTHQLVAALFLYLTVVLLPSGVHHGEAQRSYFGVYRVVQSDDGQFNVLQHGTTLHGAQRIRDRGGNPVASTTPATYYHPRSPMAAAVRLMSMLGAMQRIEPSVAVIGLGAGSLACHSASGETWKFFEIDPVVVSIAKSPSFTYLKSCQPDANIVLGDARLTFAKEKDESYDLLIVDAFSSDAVPMHLLTAEAIALYASKLKPLGFGVLHISNRYLDLEAVLASTIPLVKGVEALAVNDDYDDGYNATGSTIVVFAKAAQVIDPFRAAPGAHALAAGGLRPWTDDSSDILGPFLSRYRKTRGNP
jgi:hypothetical protein